ncbi:MAG: GCN5-like N-acetyltransferase [Lacunisphaera sp.]|nr:GCN5-like N-acetyltransferase [Lacunisphaera sp.]
MTLLPQLRRATPADVALALSWTPQADALRRWSGPATRWPATPGSLWADISAADTTTFAFDLPGLGMIAFGQVRFREQTYGHLARIIVSPTQRGRGQGRAFCLALMREAARLHPITAYSLYVFPDNLNAIGLYRSLGFVKNGMHPKFNCVLMLAPLSAGEGGAV